MRLGSYFTGGITPGTVRASKALVPDANKDLSGLRNVTMTQLTVATLVATTLSLPAQTAGAGTETFTPGGVIDAEVSQVSSANTNTTQTLITYSLPANTLNANGRGLRITAWGKFAGNAAPKTMQLNFGGALINAGAVTQSGTTFVFDAMVFRSSANNQKIIFTQNVGGVVITPKDTSDTSVDTGAIVISLQALDASAATGNVLVDGFVVEYM